MRDYDEIYVYFACRQIYTSISPTCLCSPSPQMVCFRGREINTGLWRTLNVNSSLKVINCMFISPSRRRSNLLTSFAAREQDTLNFQCIARAAPKIKYYHRHILALCYAAKGSWTKRIFVFWGKNRFLTWYVTLVSTTANSFEN